MKWTPLKIYALKLAMFSTVLGYLAVDLWLLQGPVYGFLHAEKKAAAAVATIYGERLSPRQLERHTAEQDMLAGRTKPAPALQASRVMEMVYGSLLRLRARYNDTNLPQNRPEAEAEVARLASRAGSDAAFEQLLATQGYTRRQFTDKVEARLRQQALLERSISQGSHVDNAAIMAHYKQMREEMTIPASRPVKHIFIAQHGRSPQEAEQAARLLLSRLEAGEEFGELAREASEDPRSAPQGGNLGTLYDTPTLPLEELNLFGAAPIAAGSPVLAQSRWGWHILQAGPITPAYIPSLDECRQTLRTAIISAQRELGVNAYLHSALKEGRQQKRIQIHAQ